MTRRSSRAIALALTMGLGAPTLAGCGGGDEPARTAASPPPSTAAPAPAASGLARNAGGPAVTTVARGLEVPWEIAFLPDRRALITERPGRVRLLDRDGRLSPTPVAEVEVTADGEGGLLGAGRRSPVLAQPLRLPVPHARPAQRGAALPPGRRRACASRRRSSTASPPPPTTTAGASTSAPTGSLYIATGEAGQPDLAQDRGSLGGKFLRLSPAAYRGSRAVRPQVYSLGHRNPQGFDWQPGTGRLVATEHGPSGGDGPGGSTRSTSCARAPTTAGRRSSARSSATGCVAPLAVYEDAVAPSGATFVSLPGSAWTGDFVFGTLVGEQMRRVCLERRARDLRRAAVRGRVRPRAHGGRGPRRRALRAHDQPRRTRLGRARATTACCGWCRRRGSCTAPARRTASGRCRAPDLVGEAEALVQRPGGQVVLAGDHLQAGGAAPARELEQRLHQGPPDALATSLGLDVQLVQVGDRTVGPDRRDDRSPARTRQARRHPGGMSSHRRR